MRIAAVVAAFALLLPAASWAHPRPHPKKILAGYFEEWSIYGAGYDIANLQQNGVAARIDDLYYAFGNVAPTSGAPDAQCHIADTWADYQSPYLPSVSGTPYAGPLYGNFAALEQLKQLHPKLKVLISLGGASAANAAGFAYAAGTPALRAQLAASCIGLFIEGNLAPGISAAGLFDGIDLDWEFPGAADTANFTALVAEFRRQLDALGRANHRRYLLTIAAPAGAQNYSNIDLRRVARQLDWLNLETYDYHGTWESSTNFAAPLFNSGRDPNAAEHLDINDTVEAYLRAGVPARKLLLGVPFYGRGWAGVGGTENGLYQPASGAATPPAGDSLATPGVATYLSLANLPGYTRFFDLRTLSQWLYSPTAATFWTFDDPTTAWIKMLYVDRRHLGGAFFWAFKDDDAHGTLAKTMALGLRLR